MGGHPIKAKILSYLEKKAGQRLFVTDIAQDLNESEDRVRGAILNLINRDKEPIEVNIRGQAWTYKPGSNGSATAIYEYLATTKDGRLVLQGTDGQLLVATEL